MKRCQRILASVLLVSAFVAVAAALYSPIEQAIFSLKARPVTARVMEVSSWTEDVAAVPGVLNLNSTFQDAILSYSVGGRTAVAILRRAQGLTLGKEVPLLVGGGAPDNARPKSSWGYVIVKAVMLLKVALMMVFLAIAFNSGSTASSYQAPT